MEPTLKVENTYKSWKDGAIEAVMSKIGRGIDIETAEKLVEKILKAPN